MRKYSFSTTILLVGILASGCGSMSDTMISSFAATESVSEDVIKITKYDSETESLSESTESVSVFPSTEEIPLSDMQISIEPKNEQRIFYAEDNTTSVLEVDCIYPLITLIENAEVSDKINAVISEEVDKFWQTETENSAYASEEQKMAAEDETYFFEPYTASFSYETKRCDEQIISLVFTQYDYTGGAHGNLWNYGITFDAVTGERLTIDTLSNDSNFYTQLLQTLEEQAAHPAYANYIFQDFSTDIESSLLAESTVWYFDESGISFISNPYILGPYAAGTFEFNIPYADLTLLKSSYQYQHDFMRKIFPNMETAYDLNGDGTPENICYGVLTDESFSHPVSSLTINGNDFSSVLKDSDIGSPDDKVYYLIDTNPTDTFVELAIMGNDENHKASAHIFRYTQEETLTYVGIDSTFIN